MYLIPLIRTSRAIAACSFFPDHPIVAISSSEILSYCVPFIYNSPNNALKDMIFFLFYFYLYNDCAKQLINKFKNKYILFYEIEAICILLYLLNFINN